MTFVLGNFKRQQQAVSAHGTEECDRFLVLVSECIASGSWRNEEEE